MRQEKGDILSVQRGVICHQVNCMGIMGAGLAKQVKRKFPEVWYDYKQLVDETLFPANLLGKAQIIPIRPGLWVANLFGQYNLSKRGERVTEYGSLAQSVSEVAKVVRRLQENSGQKIPIYFPFEMGCGLGGGDWEIVETILGERCDEEILEVVIRHL